MFYYHGQNRRIDKKECLLQRHIFGCIEITKLIKQGKHVIKRYEIDK